jgi:hypothetical protein
LNTNSGKLKKKKGIKVFLVQRWKFYQTIWNDYCVSVDISTIFLLSFTFRRHLFVSLFRYFRWHKISDEIDNSMFKRFICVFCVIVCFVCCYFLRNVDSIDRNIITIIKIAVIEPSIVQVHVFEFQSKQSATFVYTLTGFSMNSGMVISGY